MIEIIMATLWACFAAYAIWYFTMAKHYAPLTLTEAKILWKIHKQNTGCSSKMWREIRRGEKIVGFECECGYKHIQKRPITASAPTSKIQTQTYMYKKIHRH
ncbi:hypothetical protein KEJ45_03940 [Candidatus Bathyarchaeota archaeon]|nr:hypothetical protein [Candidatus Bathyarchaeota archaeon]